MVMFSLMGENIVGKFSIDLLTTIVVVRLCSSFLAGTVCGSSDMAKTFLKGNNCCQSVALLAMQARVLWLTSQMEKGEDAFCIFCWAVKLTSPP